MIEPYPLRFKPLFRDYLWGGTRLQSVLGKPTGPGVWAESWEVVDHHNGQSVVSQGPAAGKTLAELMQLWQGRLVGERVWQRIQDPAMPSQLRGRFPLLFKFLDAAQDLSVQVHPNDIAAARQLPPDLGKTEAWYILDAAPGSKIYAGLKRGVTRAQFAAAVEQRAVTPLLHSFPAEAGQCVFIPAGTIHAIGAGLLVAEIQQASDTTFRIEDWGRLGPDGRPRALHIPEALAVSDFEAGPVEPMVSAVTASEELLVECPYFRLSRRRGSRPFACGGDSRLHLLAVTRGRVQMEGAGEWLERGATLLVPAAAAAGSFRPEGTAELLEIQIP